MCSSPSKRRAKSSCSASVNGWSRNTSTPYSSMPPRMAASVSWSWTWRRSIGLDLAGEVWMKLAERQRHVHASRHESRPTGPRSQANGRGRRQAARGHAKMRAGRRLDMNVGDSSDSGAHGREHGRRICKRPATRCSCTMCAEKAAATPHLGAGAVWRETSARGGRGRRRGVHLAARPARGRSRWPPGPGRACSTASARARRSSISPPTRPRWCAASTACSRRAGRTCSTRR